MRSEALPDADQVPDEDLEGLAKVPEAKGGAVLAGVKMDSAD